MFLNSEEIVQQVRAEFEATLTFVLDPSSSAPSADAVERSLLRRLLGLGRSLLRLYFVHQARQHTAQSVADKQGQPVPYHSEKGRSYLSIFGRVYFMRRYYYREGAGLFPLDAALNLPPKGTSDLLREWQEQLGVLGAYHKAGDILSRLLGVNLSTRTLAEEIAEDAEQVSGYYAQSEAPTPDVGATILVVQADGKGVPMIQPSKASAKVRLTKGQKRARKKEAVVTGVYTIAPCVRTPEQVTQSFFEKTSRTPSIEAKREKPYNKRLWATLEGKEAALKFSAKQVRLQEGEHIKERVALTDGAEALQQKVEQQFADFALVLDFVHANEYLWKAANSLLGENAPEREEWVRARTVVMLRGHTDVLIGDLRQLAKEPTCKRSQSKILLSVAAYYQRNQPYMRYGTYLAKGWPIATGVIEGACRHLVKDRCELSGMRWSQPGAEALLRLRCVEENGDWEAFHAFRRTNRQRTLYGIEPNNTQPLELQLAA
jgi:hypothetical protein